MSLVTDNTADFAPAIEGPALKCANDVIERAVALSLKLEALLMQTYGEAGDGFRRLRDDLQENYLWACSGMACELRKCVDQMTKTGPQG